MAFGFMDSFKKKAPQEEAYNDNYEDDYYGEFNGYDDPAIDDGAQNMQPQATGIGTIGAGMGGISLSGTSIEMKVLKPKTFESVPQIADHLLSKRTVVLNLEDADADTSRRIIDFLFGVAYSINGSLKKIATKAYVITPNNVDVGEEKLSSKKKKQPEPEEEEETENFGAEL
ncbi:MAG: cell division protein SepF [Clostridia bacterium]|nr:cell division protein SepF [Clostridia bacterium]